MDLAVTFPNQGVIRLRSRALFQDPDGSVCRRFLERVFQADEITDVTLKGGADPQAELRFCRRTHGLGDVVNRLASFLRFVVADEPEPIEAVAEANGDSHAHANGHAHRNGNGSGDDHGGSVAVAEPPGRNGHAAPHHRFRPRPALRERTIAEAVTARDRRGAVRDYRYDSVVTGWQIKHESPGRLKLKNPVLHRKNDLCQSIERELMSVLGIDKYATSAFFSTVTVDYDPSQLKRSQVFEILDGVLQHAEHPSKA